MTKEEMENVTKVAVFGYLFSMAKAAPDLTAQEMYEAFCDKFPEFKTIGKELNNALAAQE